MTHAYHNHNANAIVGLCTLELYMAGLTSLKEKRSILKSLLARVRNTFNVTAAEIDENDRWTFAVIAVATVSNSSRHAQEVVQKVTLWIESNFPEVEIVKQKTEIL